MADTALPAYAISPSHTAKHYIHDTPRPTSTLCGSTFAFLVRADHPALADRTLCPGCERAACTIAWRPQPGTGVVHLGTEKPTLEGIRTLAVAPAESSGVTEVTIYVGSYQSVPYPSPKLASDQPSLTGFGGDARYLFHGEGLVTVEYINGDGVTSQTFQWGERIMRVYTPLKTYTRPSRARV